MQRLYIQQIIGASFSRQCGRPPGCLRGHGIPHVRRHALSLCFQQQQVAFKPVREKLVNKPEMGHLKKAGVGAHRYVREFKLDDTASYEVGQVISADVFANGDKVDVVGTSKGKGFAGNIKRWNQARGRKTHGSHSYRVAGSMGACTYPGEVFKTKHLPGHMGHERVTVQNLEVVRVDAERNLLLIKGALPGAKGGLLMVKETVK